LKKDRTESSGEIVDVYPLKEEDESKRCEHEERRERECFASEPVAIR
jgi:hypothetical protein